jgi:two-component system response regulator DevR
MVDWVMRNVPADLETSLAPREQRIVALVAEGKTNKEIGQALNLSPKTVKNYLHQIFEKLGIQRRSQAAALHAKRKI